MAKSTYDKMEEQRIKSMLAEPDMVDRDSFDEEFSMKKEANDTLVAKAIRLAQQMKSNPEYSMTQMMNELKMTNSSFDKDSQVSVTSLRNIARNALRADEISNKLKRDGKEDGGLIGGQKDLDKNNDGDITGADFAIIRKEREKLFKGTTEEKKFNESILKKVKKETNKNTTKKEFDNIVLKNIKKEIPYLPRYGENFGNLVKSFFEFIGVELPEPKVFSKFDDIKMNAAKNKEREGKQEGGMMMDDQMADMMQREETPNMENQMADMMPEKTEEQIEIEESQVPDEMMEDNYIDFLIDEALDEEEETMLMQELEANPQLSMLFDKVMEVAMEFSGSGPVEGPGSEVSDSIPARLSDGEFVFTAKAVDVIGADNLMSMMKQAEAQADERQMAQEGGLMETEDTVMPVEQEPIKQEIRVTKETVGPQASMQEEDDLVGDEIKKSMLSGRPHVRS